MSASANEGTALPAVPRSAQGELDPFTLRRAARGDARAARAFVERYQRPVFALVGRMLVGARPGEVEDLAQEVFLRAFRALPRFDPEGSAKLSTWLLTIATRACIDELRRRRPESGAEVIEEEQLHGDEDPHREVDRQQLRARLIEELSALPPPQRAALVLYEFHGWSYEAIAELIEQPIGTVRSRIARARARLRDRLQEDYR